MSQPEEGKISQPEDSKMGQPEEVDQAVPRSETEPPVKVKKPYQKPAFRFERVFETRALSCGKVSTTSRTCDFNRKSS